MHGRVCPCPNCRGPAGTALIAVLSVAVVLPVLAAAAVWLVVFAAVLAVLAAGLAVLSRYGARWSVAAWNGRQLKPLALLPKAPSPAVEAAPARLALEAAKPVLDGAVAEPAVAQGAE